MAEPMNDERMAYLRRAREYGVLDRDARDVLAAVERVMVLHHPVDYQGRVICDRDGGKYPCATIRALEGATE